MKAKTVILGAGIAGLAYAEETGKETAVVFEKNKYSGGLCHSFKIDEFTFDCAVHLSFTNDTAARMQFDKVPYVIHQPVSYNFYDGYWLKHPVVNNLYPLNAEKKVQLLSGFVNRKTDIQIHNYKDWLLASYGKEFSENFYEIYTKKYWTTDAEKLSTTWIGNRLGTPDIKKMLWGAFSDKTGLDYYAKEMRYPQQGGYQSFINSLEKDSEILYGKRAIKLNLNEKKIIFQDNSVCYYEKLASSIPLPELVKITEGIPENLKRIALQLKASKISLVSIGLRQKNISPSVWFYIYDEDIFAARVNSPSMKSENNAPAGCSSLQFEIYHAPDQIINKAEIIENTRYALKKMHLCEEKDIIFLDYRLLEYGNVIFENGMEEKRDKIKRFYEKYCIDLIGRFGEWEYYWSDQSYISGKNKGRRQIR